MKKLKSFIGLSLAAALPITAGLLGTNHVNFKNKQNLKTFNGHFPGMGPYGSKRNQDHALGYTTNGPESDFFYARFDLSTTSINWINTHYTGPGTKGDTVWYGIYDFLTDAYPSGAFTKTLYNIKINSHTPSINTIMKHLSDYIGLNGKHENELALKPAFMSMEYATDGTWNGCGWGPNVPFSA